MASIAIDVPRRDELLTEAKELRKRVTRHLAWLDENNADYEILHALVRDLTRQILALEKRPEAYYV